jgi:hypothetical protein
MSFPGIFTPISFILSLLQVCKLGQQELFIISSLEMRTQKFENGFAQGHGAAKWQGQGYTPVF